jgi:hypothetical protein
VPSRQVHCSQRQVHRMLRRRVLYRHRSQCMLPLHSRQDQRRDTRGLRCMRRGHLHQRLGHRAVCKLPARHISARARQHGVLRLCCRPVKQHGLGSMHSVCCGHLRLCCRALYRMPPWCVFRRPGRQFVPAVFPRQVFNSGGLRVVLAWHPCPAKRPVCLSRMHGRKVRKLHWPGRVRPVPSWLD